MSGILQDQGAKFDSPIQQHRLGCLFLALISFYDLFLREKEIETQESRVPWVNLLLMRNKLRGHGQLPPFTLRVC